MDLSKTGEFGFLDRLRNQVGASESIVGIGDDAAVMAFGASRLVATVDTIAEGRHFRLDWSSAADVGFKAIAVNLSDLAAMGAMPRFVLLSLGAPANTALDWLDGLYDGISQACEPNNVGLVGGDLVAADEISLTVTALGELDGDAMLRSNLVVGDVLAVTGTLGRSAAGVKALEAGLTSEAAQVCIAAHRRPQARVNEGLALRRAGVRAAMDLSDGLLSDVRRMSEMSAVGVNLEAARIPVDPHVQAVAADLGMSAFDLATCGGEDFELLVSLPASRLASVGVELTVVGEVTDNGLNMVGPDGMVDLPAGGWDHFS